MATSTFGRSWHIPSSAITEIVENALFSAYWALFCINFDDPNINLKGLLCIFYMCSLFLNILLLFFEAFIKFTWSFDFFIPRNGIK